MNWYVIITIILLWGFSTDADEDFYMEKIKTDATQGGKSSVVLYTCVDIRYPPEPYIICRTVQDSTEKENVYNKVNFHSVTDLQLQNGYSVLIDMTQTSDDLSDVWTVGVEPKLLDDRACFKPECPDWRLVRDNINRLTRLDNINVPQLVQYFSVNDISWFWRRNAQDPEMYLMNYATALGKAMKAGPRGFSFLKKMGFGSKSWSLSRSRSRSPTRTPPRSLSLPPPRSLSRSQSQKELTDVLSLLSLKMFDPCHALRYKDEKDPLANHLCTVHCTFLSAVIKLTGEVYSNRCKDLTTGVCVWKRCVCQRSQRCGSKIKEEVNMEFCNNSFRLYGKNK